MTKFTVRVPEQYIDFEFKLYANEKIEDPIVLEALDEKAWDTVYDTVLKIEVYDEHGFQLPIPSLSKPDEDGVKGPGTNPGA